MSTKQFTLTINKSGLKSRGGLDIPSGFIFKGTDSGISFNTLDDEGNPDPGVGYTGKFYLNANEEEALVIKGASADPRRGISDQVGGLAKDGCVTIDDSGSDRVVTLNNTGFLNCVKADIAAFLGCETSDIV